jgi:hypothetical protein
MVHGKLVLIAAIFFVLYVASTWNDQLTYTSIQGTVVSSFYTGF